MLKNYIKVAVRNIVRHPGYSFINITGLAVGMACCILILLWVQDELSFDRFHAKAGDIYRVIQEINFTDHSTTWAITQGPLGPSLKADFPDIPESVRFTRRGMRLSYGDKVFDELVGMADGSIFSVFSFPLLRGEPEEALSDPFSMVLTAEMARKYFGAEDPLGKILLADDRFEFKITGILKEVPRNSHLQFDFLIPFIFGRELGYSVDRWNNSSFNTYVLLTKDVPAAEVVAKISRYLDDKPTIEKDAALNLQPLTRIHLHSRYEFDMAHGDITYVTIFSLVAFFILLIACINFMNLTTARSSNRAREVGMRKVAGAYRFDLIKQFLGESMLLAMVAFALALILVWLLLPAFNQLAAKELTPVLFTQPWLWMGLLAVALVAGIIAGSYPALFLSGFQPVRIFKGAVPSGMKSSAFRRVLVVVQFSLSVLFIFCTLVVYTQIDYMRHKKLGYDQEHLLYFRMRGQMRDRFEAAKQELLSYPGILQVAAGANVPTYGYSFSNSLWRWEGQSPDEELLMRATFVDADFFATLGIEIVDGRPFSQEFTTDEKFSCVINEAAARAMRIDDPVGQKLSLSDDEGTIVGVVRDYHFRSLHQEIDPLIHIFVPERSRVLFARIGGEEMPAAIAHMERVWNKFAPGFDFRYRFMDDALDDLYRAEQRTGTIFRTFSLLAVMISCLGLFGLASYMAERRTKEIGIRKVLGATASHIVLLLSKDFTKWVMLANVLAWPVAYYAMYRWLQGYAYRISLPWWAFGFAAGLALAIATATVSVQSVRAAKADPVNSLKYE